MFKRKQFLVYSGVGLAGTVLAMAGCDKNQEKIPDIQEAVYLGTGDTALLNFSYVFEQLNAAFYTQVIARPYSGMTELERIFLTEIRDHEIAHREFFKSLLGDRAIPSVDLALTDIDFESRAAVLELAKRFEDLGVAAYNGVARLMLEGVDLLLIGKIVSVEARHAAWIRDALSKGSFADDTVIDQDGFDANVSPNQALEGIQGYLLTELDGRDLPTY